MALMQYTIYRQVYTNLPLHTLILLSKHTIIISRGSNTKIESHIGLPIQRIPMSEDFVKVADTKDIQPSHMKEVQVDGENICVVNIEGKYYAISNICTHEGGPLADGTLEGFEVECPWHGSKFDVRSGEVMSPPASEPEQTYQVKVDGNSILIKKNKVRIINPPKLS